MSASKTVTYNQFIMKTTLAYTGGYYRFGIEGTHELTSPMRYNTYLQDMERNVNDLPTLKGNNINVTFDRNMGAAGNLIKVSITGSQWGARAIRLWLMADYLNAMGAHDYPEITCPIRDDGQPSAIEAIRDDGKECADPK